jgi:transposase
VSTTSKSPKNILLTALSVGQAKLSAYSHRNSPRKFTQPQLFACLVLKTSLGLDYRGLEGLLDDSADLCQLIGLESVPHYTTFQKASRKLLANSLVQSLLDETVTRALGRRKAVEHAAIDSTGLECSAASNYFVKRRDRVENPWKTVTYSHYPKLAIVCRTCDHFILAFSSRRGPKPDVDEFKDLVSVAAKRVKLRCIVADAGYDSESNHQFARESLASRSIFPAKHGRPTSKPASGRYRRLMQVRFDRKTYRKRVQVETVVSMIKRRLGNHVRARSRWGQVRELALVVLTHNLMILWCSILFYRACQEPFFYFGRSWRLIVLSIWSFWTINFGERSSLKIKKRFLTPFPHSHWMTLSQTCLSNWPAAKSPTAPTASSLASSSGGDKVTNS